MEQEQSLRDQVAALSGELKTGNVKVRDMNWLDDEIALTAQSARTVRSEVEALTVELAAQPRIRLIERARQAPNPPILDQAGVLLAEARARRPGWTRAILAAAEVDDLRGDSAAALRAYLAAIEKGERDSRSLRRAVELLYRLGRFAQADTLLAQVQDDAPLSPELGRLAADVALRVQDDDRALTLARQALTGRTNSSADQVWLGQLLLAAARQAENRRRPDQVRTRRLEAEQAFRRGIELAPDDPDARVALVAALAGWDRRDEARATIRAAEGHLKGPTGDLALARCFEAVGQTDQAEAKL